MQLTWYDREGKVTGTVGPPGQMSIGALSPDGVHHILFRRSKLAGIKPRGPHALRHTFAHKLKLEGVSEEDLMRLGGWRDVKSMHRYGNSAADERAREVARKHSLSDRF